MNTCTVAEARTLLQGKLKFGDPQQVEAVKTLSALAEVQSLLQQYPNVDLACEHCSGQGVRCRRNLQGVAVQLITCDLCDGTGAWLSNQTLEFYTRPQLLDTLRDLQQRIAGY
jgi:hypothetical protein